MPTIDLGQVKGDTGASMRMIGAWTAKTAYVNNPQYIDVVTNGGNSYACTTSHTSGTSFSAENWIIIAKKGDTGAKGATGTTPTIKAGTVTSLDSTASPTVSASTSGTTTTFNFGIPKGDTSDIKTPTFDDSVGTYSTLATANTAAETASNAIKSKTNIFTILSNMKKSFSAIVQGLKMLNTNVGAIHGITSDINSESTEIAASSKMVHDINNNLKNYLPKSYVFGGRTYASYDPTRPRLLYKDIALPAAFAKTDVNNYFVNISPPETEIACDYCPFILKSTGNFSVYFRRRSGEDFQEGMTAWFDYTIVINH